jgi:cell division protein FtsZ
VHDAASIIREAVHEDAHIIFGAVTDEKLEDELRVTVIATGFHHRDADARALRPGGRSGQDMHGNDPSQQRRPRSQNPKEAAPPAEAGGRRLDIPAFVRRKVR